MPTGRRRIQCGGWAYWHLRFSAGIFGKQNFPTSSGWGMPKKKEGVKKYELVRLAYRFKFQKTFKEPCTEWLELIEIMCNEILGNYTKKEDQLMIVAFGTRPKQRFNRVMDALNFEYPNYESLDKGAGGVKRKRVFSILSRQAVQSVKEDQETLKKIKTMLEPKISAPKKRKLDRISSTDTKLQDVPEKTISPPSPSAAEVSEILKVMTESIAFALLCPLRLDLTSLLQSKETTLSMEGKAGGQKKWRMMNVMQAIEQTPPPASAAKAAMPIDAEDTAEAEADELATTMSEIDRLISDVVAKKDVAATPFDKGKRIEDASSEDKDFDLRHLGGQLLSEVDKS
jgi:hypothetical protein